MFDEPPLHCDRGQVGVEGELESHCGSYPLVILSVAIEADDSLVVCLDKVHCSVRVLVDNEVDRS